MIYDTIDIIPAKVYFRIIETGDITLLAKGDAPESELKLAWESIEAQHNLLEQGKDDKKAIDVPKRIESLLSKFEAIKLAVYVLRREDDDQMKDLLRAYGFPITKDLDNDLDRVEKESEAIGFQIDALRLKLPKINKDSSAKTTFDKVVLSYGALTGLGFIDTNRISLTQYYALIETGNDKIKALEATPKGKGKK